MIYFTDFFHTIRVWLLPGKFTVYQNVASRTRTYSSCQNSISWRMEDGEGGRGCKM